MEYRSNENILNNYYEKTGRRRRKILVVDDDDISREVLGRILGDYYEMVNAENGQEALEILRSRSYKISLILLDLIMPVMGGYEFLDIFTKDEGLSSIPVIVTTSRDCEEDEVRCLESGASDYVLKPYHPEVVRRRVDRIIRLRETASILNMVERDRLTGLYSKESFYLEVERLLECNPDIEYDMVVADVEKFKLINDRLGTRVGDQVLCYLADQYRQILGDRGICARLHGDVFAILIEHGDGSWKRPLLRQWNEDEEGVPLRNMVIKYGIYENVNRAIPPFGMCDRAILALKRIKNMYGRYAARYDDSLRAQLLREQQIQDCMEEALREHQFQVYYQPKYDINNNRISGAEVLVRWKHPEYGFMSPGEFIPLFERNGFITQLDFYVWEETCRNIKRWMDEGRSLVPISVNISRMDFETPDLAQQIVDLVDSYGIDRELLHLEITESVYTDEKEGLINEIHILKQSGFKIEMDDFGTGYSSLNMLSEIEVDVLKLDMRFIQDCTENKRSILSFVISLAKWLNLTTVAEGVETSEQVEQLKRFGCDFVQGYYYAKPMSLSDFEKFMDGDSQEQLTVQEETFDLEIVTPEPSEVKKNTVLIVEDNGMNREILRDMLEPFYNVVEALNGMEAFEYLNGHPGKVSVILLDLIMPVMDGFQFMRKRAQEKTISEIPVIVTSELDGDSNLMALRMGAERFVAKPYSEELVLLSVKNAVEHWNLEHQK